MNGKAKNPRKPGPMSVFVSVFEKTASTATDSIERSHFLDLARRADAHGVRSKDEQAFDVMRAYVEAITNRTADLLAELDPHEQRVAMEELARAAAEGGLITDENAVRQKNLLQFAMDLFEGNPAAIDFRNAKVRYDGMPTPPSRFENLDEIASELRPSRR